jgi:hypothetical protein
MAEEETSVTETSGKIQHGRTVIWGTAGVKDAVQSVTSSGIVQSVSLTYNAEKETVEDENGETCTVIIGNRTQSIEFSVICESDTSAPTAGAKLSGDLTGIGLDISNGTCIVDDGVKINWQNKGAKEMTIPATFYPNIK